MILINMMMAIINMAFEEIKSQSEAYKNKFEIMEYIKRSTRKLTGLRWIITLHYKIYLFSSTGPLCVSYQNTKRRLGRTMMRPEAKKTMARRNHFRTNSQRKRTSCWTTLRRLTSRVLLRTIRRARTSLKS